MLTIVRPRPTVRSMDRQREQAEAWWKNEAILSRKLGAFDRAEFAEEQLKRVSQGLNLFHFRGLLYP